MRKITVEAVEALKNGRAFNKSNTSVYFLHGLRGMELHGNHIASYNKEEKKLLIRDAWWQSNTTKERLNGILWKFWLWGIFQKNWKWYYENQFWKVEEWKGEKVIELN